jgi:hypothetical protein
MATGTTSSDRAANCVDRSNPLLPGPYLLTATGLEAARELRSRADQPEEILSTPLKSKGRVTEFAANLTAMQLAALDVVADQEVRYAGGAATRSHVRAAVRNAFAPPPSVEEVHGALDALVGSHHLQVLGESFRVTLRGLLASRWGHNALDVIGRTLDLIRRSLSLAIHPRPITRGPRCDTLLVYRERR